MIISKKKFNRLVEEEAFKMLHEIEEKRKEADRHNRLEEMIRLTDCQVQVLRDEVETLKHKIPTDKREHCYA